MDSGYLIMFIILLVITVITGQAIRLGKYRVLKNKLEKGGFTMTKEIIEKMIGKQFCFSSGSFSSRWIVGTVLSVDENWIEIQTKKDVRFLNADFLLEIRERKKQ